jgi:DNA-binding CsgD family transcriptional regulator
MPATVTRTTRSTERLQRPGAPSFRFTDWIRSTTDDVELRTFASWTCDRARDSPLALTQSGVRWLGVDGHRGDGLYCAGLSEQERRVFDLIGEGLTTRQIGERLFLAEKTVKNYVSSVLSKLGMQRRTQAAALAARRQESQRPRPQDG